MALRSNIKLGETVGLLLSPRRHLGVFVAAGYIWLYRVGLGRQKVKVASIKFLRGKGGKTENVDIHVERTAPSIESLGNGILGSSLYIYLQKLDVVCMEIRLWHVKAGRPTECV